MDVARSKSREWSILAREEARQKPIPKKRRVCLKCRKSFWSDGYRVCKPCTHVNKNIFDITGEFTGRK